MAKLIEGDIDRIRDMVAMGCEDEAIGEWFGVSRKAIYDIRKGRRWTYSDG